MSEVEPEPLEEINRKMDRILKLMVHDQFEEDSSIKEKIQFLQRMGFDDNQEMAEVIGTTKGTISTKKSQLNTEENND